MSEIYARNIEALARRDSELARSLATVELELGEVSVEMAESGRPCLALRTSTGKMPLEDRQDPAGAARRKIAEFSESIRLVVVKGAGLGYLWKAAQARRNLERIVLVEPQKALFALMMGVTDMRRVFEDSRVELVIGGDPREFPRSCRKRYDYGTEAGRLLVVLPPNAVLRHPVMALASDFDAAFDAEWRAVSAVSERNRTTLEKFVHVWRRNLLANLDAILLSAPVLALRGACGGRPGILVGAGPSLDRNVDALRQVRGRAAIVAVDTAYRTLKRHGIVPDLVVAVDATIENVGDFEGVSVGDDPTALVMVPVVHPMIPKLFERRYVASYGHPVQKAIEQAMGAEFGSLLVSGSVATIAFDLLRFMGARPIIFAGLDLAMGARSHTKGSSNQPSVATRFESTERDQWKARRGATIARPGWGGGEVWTTEQMLRWAEWFEAELRSASDARGSWPTVNATEGGIRIAGATEMTLVGALERHLGKKVPPLIDRFKPMLDRRRVRERLRAASGFDHMLLWERAVLREPELAAARRELEEALAG